MDDHGLKVPEHRVFVVGQPRSGTSMMTHACELLGVDMQHGTEEVERKQKRNERFAAQYGEYHPNANGFFEVGGNIFDTVMHVVAHPFSGFKLIIPFPSNVMPSMLKTLPCKVIYMRRDPLEIAESQRAFFNPQSALPQIEMVYAETDVLFDTLGIDSMQVQYRNVLVDPVAEMQRIATFIQSPASIDAAVASIRPKDIRFKREELLEATQ